MKRIISISIDETLVKRIDEQAVREGRSRSNWLEMAARMALHEEAARRQEREPITKG